MTITLVVEDGTGKVDSNTYNSVADFILYCQNRNEINILQSDIPGLLIKSADYIDSLDYLGFKTTKQQAMAFPRLISSVSQFDDRYGGGNSLLVDGYSVLSNEIPARIKKAHLAVALAMGNGNDPTATIDRASKKETVGPLSVEYVAGATYSDNAATFTMPLVQSLLEPLLADKGTGCVVDLIRS